MNTFAIRIPAFFRTTHDREIHIETIRGLACLALVSLHVVGYTPRNAMELPLDDWLSILQRVFIDMRMPLFSFISGYVFLSVPKVGQTFKLLLKKKARRLLIPMVTVGTLFWLTQSQFSSSPQPPLLSIYVFQFAHYWFLQATFLLMAGFLLLNAILGHFFPEIDRNTLATKNAAAIGIIGAITWIGTSVSLVEFFSIGKAFYLAPFFMSGYLVASRKQWISSTFAPGRKVAGVILVLLAGLGYFLASGSLVPGEEVRRFLSVLIGVSTAISLYILAPKSRVLAWIGDKSYAIYLFHVFFTAGALIIWRKVVPGGLDIHYAYPLGLTAGIVGPIILYQLITASSIASWLLLGLPNPFSSSQRKCESRSQIRQRKRSGGLTVAE